jgi:restriction endonuclease S subunit
MNYSIIQKSQLEGALRLDAEYYQPEYLNLISNLKTQKSKFLLKELTEKIVSGSYIDTYFEKGALYLRVNNITEYDFDLSDIKFVDINFSKIPSKITIKAGDLVLGRTGTIGLTHLVDERLDGAVMSQHITKIIVNEKLINKYYLIAYLNSKFTRKQMEREALGSMQVELTLDATKNLLVLVPTPKEQEEIGDLIQKFYELNKQSEAFYSQAEDLLLEELGLKDFKVGDDLSYIVNLSKIKSAHRADAEYFQPKYERLISKIKYKMEKLNNLLLPKGGIKKGIEIGSEQYQEEGKLFIRVSNLSKHGHGLVERDQKYLSEELYQKLKKDFEPKVGEILLTKDATPGIAYLLKEPVEGIIAGGILRLRVKPDINPEYLALVINSIVGQIQVEKDTGGSVIFHWRPNQIKNILIPILPKPTQQKIADLVQKSHEARQKAKQLLEEAKRKVEELIEKN